MLGLSAFFGAIVAALADLIQKNQASAVLTISSMVQTSFRVWFPPLLAVALLIVLAIAICFIFGADTNKNAFYIGASILSAIMVVTPYQALGSLPTSPGTGNAGPAVLGGWLDPSVAYAQSPVASRLVQVRITLKTPDNAPISQVTLTLRDASTQRIIGQSVLSGNRVTLYAPSGEYTLSIEVDGYQIEKRSLFLSEQPVSLDVPLKPTWVPIFVQRVLTT